nr:reverse transcriptase domain-containing protein [Tanacetum cinerariifolium]
IRRWRYILIPVESRFKTSCSINKETFKMKAQSDKLDDALWAFRTACKTPIGCTPYKLVYGKACHIPVELEHKAYWALKHANFDLKTAGDHRKVQINEVNELRKLKSRWSGPFTISQVYPYGTVELSQPDGPNFKVNGHRLKHYFGEDMPKLNLKTHAEGFCPTVFISSASLGNHVQSPPPQQQSPPLAQPQGAHFLMSLLQEALDVCAALTRRVEHLEHDKGRVIDESDKDEGTKLMNEKEEKETKEVRVNPKDAQVEGRQADIYHIDMDHATKVLSMQEDEPEIQEAVEVVTTAKLITKVVVAVSETVSVAAVVQADVPAALVNTAVVVTTAPPVKRYQVMKKRLQTEAQARRNMMVYLKNTAGFTLDYFKGMTYDDIRPIFEAKFNANMEFLLKSKELLEEEESRAIALINETPAQKAAKRRRLNKEAEDVEELKQHLEIVPDEDDDVYTEATPLARKVPVVDYQIVHVNNKPRYKIIRAEDTHQLYRSFITMLKNFDREDLETLWNIVKERFSTSKPNNFSDEYLLSTLKTMFGRPDGQDNVWKDQRSVHGQALVKSWKLLTSCGVHIISFTSTQIILLYERRYPLSKFTLEKMLNVVRLQVEEQSEMSLELIRFTR